MRILLTLLIGIIFVSSVAALEAFCPGGASPNANVLYCNGFETATTPFPDGFIGARESTGDAAVGTGSMVIRAVPGGTGAYGGGVWTATDTINVRYYFKFKDGYVLPVGNNWNHGPDIRSTGDCGVQFMPDWTMSRPPNLHMLTNCPGTSFQDLVTNRANVTLQNNRWYLAEMQVTLNTPGQSNGVARMWVDEQLLLEYTALNIRGTANTLFSSGLIYNTYTHRLQPVWPQKMLFDNIVVSRGTYIGPAVGENSRGTADPLSPYPLYIAYQAIVGHRPGSDCWVSPGVTGGGFDSAWRSGVNTLQTTVTNGVYRGTCNNNPDQALRVDVNQAQQGGGIAYSIGSLIPPQLAMHGSIYLPSTNNYSQTFALAGLTKYDVDNFQPGGTSWAKYIAFSVVNNQWAIVQRNSGVQTTAATTGTVTYDTWHEFELILHQNNTVSLMIDRAWVFRYLSPPASLTWVWNEEPGIVPDSRQAIYGVLHSNITQPLTVYYDDIDVMGPSAWSCEGWHASSCPFAAAAPPPADTTPPTATITAPTAAQVLAAGTTSATLSVTTDESATCRWSMTDVVYGSMPNTMAGSGSTSHTSTLSGLVNGGTNTTYVRCQDAAQNNMTTSQSRTFSIAMPTPTIIWESNWSYATGTSYDAIMDGTGATRKYDYLAGCTEYSYSQVLEVIPGSSLGWSITPNVLQISHRGPTYCGNVQTKTTPALPSATSHYGRTYVRNDGVSGSQHGIAYNCCGAIQLVPLRIDGRANDFTLILQMSRDQNGNTHPEPYRWGFGSPPLQNDRWYRYEWYVEYITPNPGSLPGAVRLWPRVYEMDGTLVYDSDDFISNYPPTTLTEWYANGGMGGITDLQLAREWSVGQEGSGGSTDTGAHTYLAAVAFSRTNWIGGTTQTPAPSSVCGNGVIEASESCDAGGSNGACPASCSASCTTNACGTGNTPTITVSSTYAGYTTTPINDGVINAAGGTSTTWASGQSDVEPHWIELTFPTSTTLSSITLHWTQFAGTYLTSQEMQIQRWDGSAWQTITTMTNSGSVANSSVSFTSAPSTRYRIYQPANQGNPNYPTVIWITELDYTTTGTRRVGDLDGNGIVNILDVTLIIQNFKRRMNYDEGADINGDGIVNIFDMVLLGRNWG